MEGRAPRPSLWSRTSRRSIVLRRGKPRLYGRSEAPTRSLASKISSFRQLPAKQKTGVIHHPRRSQLLRLSVSPQLMATAVNFDLRRGFRLREVANLRHPWFVGLLFAALMARQALGFLVLGTGRAGLGLPLSILVLHN